MKSRVKRFGDERGFVLVLTLLLLLIVSFIGMSAVSTATYDVSISGNRRISEKTFCVAESGMNEFKGRFRPDATGEISDNDPTDRNWRSFLARNTARATQIGYNNADSNHHFDQSLQDRQDYAVEVRHKLDAANNVVTQEGSPVYILTSHGYTPEGGNKVIEAELTSVRKPADSPSALYSKAPVRLQGSSTYISGMDQCSAGEMPSNKPGIITTTPTITESGSPVVQGDPPQETDSSLNVPLAETVRGLGKIADFAYEYSADQTLTNMSDNWGKTTSVGTTTPISYEGPMNVVYFDMNGDKTIKLAGGCHGAGLLLVNGNLELNGGFTWYGQVIVTGALNFSGGGEKNISGGVLAGETSVVVNTEVGGDVGILYCSKAIESLKMLPPYKITQWREVY
jgi:Tfp pilus assembly protein PilX